jgi:hypothetical protein
MTGPVKATRSRRFRNDSGIALRALTDPRFSTERNAVCRCCVTGHAPAEIPAVRDRPQHIPVVDLHCAGLAPSNSLGRAINGAFGTFK